MNEASVLLTISADNKFGGRITVIMFDTNWQLKFTRNTWLKLDQHPD